MYIQRKLEGPLKTALKHFPAVLITGPRQAGKSTLLQHTLKDYGYVSFDDILVRNLAESDPALLTTAKDWLTLLQSTSIIYLLEPYFKNLTKRVVKSPKLFLSIPVYSAMC